MKSAIKIDPSVHEICPHIRLGCLSFEANVSAPDEDFWELMEEEICPKWMAYLADHELSEVEGIHASREVYRAFGRAPSKNRVSSEALLRRVRQGHPLYRINSVVDVNNLISIESGLSVGSYDLDKIQGDITLRIGHDDEEYEGIGRGMIPMDHMLVTADELGAFGSSLSDSTRTMVTEDSRRILVVIHDYSEKIDLEQLMVIAKRAFEDYAEAAYLDAWVVE